MSYVAHRLGKVAASFGGSLYGGKGVNRKENGDFCMYVGKR